MCSAPALVCQLVIDALAAQAHPPRVKARGATKTLYKLLICEVHCDVADGVAMADNRNAGNPRTPWRATSTSLPCVHSGTPRSADNRCWGDTRALCGAGCPARELLCKSRKMGKD